MIDNTFESGPPAHKILRVGHRGARGYAPENTLASFRKALELKVDMFELDVHLCRSGEVVVLHDATVDRTTGGRGAVAGKTLTRLKQLDAGEGEKIPTLEEVLELTAGQCAVNIELKGESSGPPVVGIITRSVKSGVWIWEHFLVSAFDHEKLWKVKELEPRIRVGPLVSSPPADFAEFARGLGAWSVHVAQEHLDLRAVNKFRACGFKVFAYTANSLREILHLKALAVDGIISDYPDRV